MTCEFPRGDISGLAALWRAHDIEHVGGWIDYQGVEDPAYTVKLLRNLCGCSLLLAIAHRAAETNHAELRVDTNRQVAGAFVTAKRQRDVRGQSIVSNQVILNLQKASDSRNLISHHLAAQGAGDVAFQVEDAIENAQMHTLQINM